MKGAKSHPRSEPKKCCGAKKALGRATWLRATVSGAHPGPGEQILLPPQRPVPPGQGGVEAEHGGGHGAGTGRTHRGDTRTRPPPLQGAHGGAAQHHAEEKLRFTGTKWALPPPSGGKGWSQAPWQTRGGAGAIGFPSWAPLGRGSRLHGLITSLPLIQRRVSHSLAGARFGSQAQPGEFPAF